MFWNLAFINQLRGTHSTGVTRIWKEKGKYRTEIRKDAVSADEFYKRKENSSTLEDVTVCAVMGHNRFATVGARDNVLGAHPFENDRFIGFHNGTLTEKRFTDHKDYVTDSEALYAELADKERERILDKSIDELAPEAVKTLECLSKDSAFALAYFDKQDGVIGFIRNDKRTLYFAVHQTRRVCYYSSEREMLEFVLDRADINFSSYALNPWKSLRTNPDRMEFAVRNGHDPKLRDRLNTWWINDLKPTPIDPPPPPVVSRINYDYGSHYTRSSHAITCTHCNEELDWATSRNGRNKSENPEHIKGYGLVCYECYDFFNNFTVNDDKQAIH